MKTYTIHTESKQADNKWYSDPNGSNHLLDPKFRQRFRENVWKFDIFKGNYSKKSLKLKIEDNGAKKKKSPAEEQSSPQELVCAENTLWIIYWHS